MKNLINLVVIAFLTSATALAVSPVATPQEIAAQSKLKNKISYSQAVKMALDSLATDLDDNESPMALMLEDVYADHKIDFDQASAALKQQLFAQAQNRLSYYLNQPETQFYLVPLELDESEDASVYPAEHGESVSENWIFFLTLPGYSDHLFWTVIDRSGVQKPYTYGFN